MSKALQIRIMRESPGSPGLHLPKHPGDAGLDLVVSKSTELVAGAVTAVPCGFCMSLPEGVAALVIPRSSAVREGIMVHTTLIDQGYIGDIYVMATTLSYESITVLEGSRIAQLLPIAILADQMEIVEVDRLPASSRGTAGFGSTGGTNGR